MFGQELYDGGVSLAVVGLLASSDNKCVGAFCDNLISEAAGFDGDMVNHKAIITHNI